jgi:hypothetical protein
VNHCQQYPAPHHPGGYNLAVKRWFVIKRMTMRRNAGVTDYATSLNFAFGAPQTGHLSGASPTTVLPHTSQTWMAAGPTRGRPGQSGPITGLLENGSMVGCDRIARRAFLQEVEKKKRKALRAGEDGRWGRYEALRTDGRPSVAPVRQTDRVSSACPISSTLYHGDREQE